MLKYSKYKLFESSESYNWKDLIESPKVTASYIRDLNKRIMLKKLEDNGIKDRVAQANILAEIQHECGFIPKTEYTTYSAKRLMEIWGPDRKNKKNTQRFDTLQDAQDTINKGKSHLFDVIYGNRMGNKEPGDALKYRGRGLIQLTGKHNYEVIGKKIGIDLVSNPELALHPKYTFDIAIEYLKYRASDLDDLRSMDKLKYIIGYATDDTEQRKATAKNYHTLILSNKLQPIGNAEEAIAKLENKTNFNPSQTTDNTTEPTQLDVAKNETPEKQLEVTPEQIKSQIKKSLNFDIVQLNLNNNEKFVA